MIVYLDASALVKRYVVEVGSRETLALTAIAEIVATSIISRAEVGAALAKGVRVKHLDLVAARRAQRAFTQQWADFARIPITDALVARAEALTWQHTLRGYDAVHLAAALTWQESVGSHITLATFDRQLWSAAREVGLDMWPEKL